MIMSQIMSYLIKLTIVRWVSGLLGLMLLGQSRLSLCGRFSSFLMLVSRCWPSTVCMSSVSRLWKTARTGSRSNRLQHQNQNHSEYSWSDVRYVVCWGEILVGSFVGSYFFVLSCVHFISSSFPLWFMFYMRFFVFPFMHLFVTAIFCKYFCLTCFFSLQCVWNKLLNGIMLSRESSSNMYYAHLNNAVFETSFVL